MEEYFEKRKVEKSKRANARALVRVGEAKDPVADAEEVSRRHANGNAPVQEDSFLTAAVGADDVGEGAANGGAGVKRALSPASSGRKKKKRKKSKKSVGTS